MSKKSGNNAVGVNVPCALAISGVVMASIIPVDCLGEKVYRCYSNGTPTFTEMATDRSCQRMEVTPHQPDPDTIARQTNELERWQEHRTAVLGSKTRNKRNAPADHGTPVNRLDRERPESRNTAEQAPELPGVLQFQDQDMPQ